MKRIIVKIHPHYSGTDDFYLEEPSGYIADADRLYPFESKRPSFISKLKSGLLKPMVVTKAGEWLLEKLEFHPAVAKAMAEAFTVPRPELYPIYIQAESKPAEELPWETLFHHNSGFLNLDGRWPIGRIANSDDRTTPTNYVCPVPIRMMAILSAAGIAAQPEWDALHAAIQKSNLPLTLRVLVSEDSLYKQIENLHDPAITVSYIPTDAVSLRRDIEGFRPSILHFFCHGSNDKNTGPALHLAIREDWLAATGSSSLRVELASFEKIRSLNRYCWLITLNCCKSAATVAHAEALARSLVQKGFPLVIGMREVVASADANLFCQTFYEDTFNEIQGELSKNSPAIEICWPHMLSTAREKLGLKYAGPQALSSVAGEVKEWTLPVLYSRRAPVILQPWYGSNPNQLDRLSILGETTEVLSTIPGMPESVLDNLIKKETTSEQRTATAGASG